MIHSTSPCDAPRSKAMACWATLSPETGATTATRALHTANNTKRWRRRSLTTAPSSVGAVMWRGR